jgi:pimeloyl-ACP methyl ester carboxylesterase
MTTVTASPSLSDSAEPQYVDGAAARYPYRRFGEAGAAPLVFSARFRATIDHWDRALLDLLAAEREVIVFDNVGTASSTGTTPTTFEGLADGAVQFIEALGLSQVDRSAGRWAGVWPRVALERPDLARRLVLAGTGPGGVPNQPQPPEKVWQVAPKPVLETRTIFTCSSRRPTPPARRRCSGASTTDSIARTPRSRPGG